MVVPRRRIWLLLVVLACCAPAVALAQGGLPERAKAQISAFIADKARWTPAQQKMDSQLIYAARMMRGEPVVPGMASLPSVFNRVKVDRQGIVTLDVQATVDAALLAALRALGGQIVSAFPEYGAARVQLPLGDVEAAAAIPAVRFVGPAEEPRFNRVRASRSAAAGRSARQGPITNTIARSEGDHAHAADVVRAMGITGAGVKVGVLSSGVDSLAAQQTAGALPAVTVLSGQAGSGDEGTAMLEIVYTLAPGAQLYFATGFGGVASFASNISALRAAGCDVIIDDVTYFNEGVFQDGPIAQAVESVTAGGALYFSSAANSGNEDSGTSGTWEGDFVAGTSQAGFGTFHDFSANNIFDQITANADALVLKWSDPLGASTNDYDLYLTDGSGNVLAMSTTRQNGTQDPYELIQAPIGGGYAGDFLVIAKFSGISRALHLDTERGQLQFNTPAATFGHNAAAGALTVAATDVGNAAGNPFAGGAQDPVETYSSDGPRRLFFNADGSAITPNNFLIATNGGIVLSKPDLTAADCVSNNTSGFSPFCGTSAAAPHAGAIAALAKSMPSHPTAAQIKAAMLSSALDIMGAGVDRDSGSGVVMANRTIATLTPPPPPLKFYTANPCRVVDTRNPAGALGGPALQPNAIRSFVLIGVCNVPAGARALSVNITVTQPTALGDLRLYPADLGSPPLISSINYSAGQTRANNAVVKLATATGAIDVQTDSGGTVQFILDVNGYFQ